jgi:hypothetical protein
MMRRLIALFRMTWAEKEILGQLPSRLGTTEWLIPCKQSKTYYHNKCLAGAGLGTREKMAQRPNASPADHHRGTNEKTG